MVSSRFFKFTGSNHRCRAIHNSAGIPAVNIRLLERPAVLPEIPSSSPAPDDRLASHNRLLPCFTSIGARASFSRQACSASASAGSAPHKHPHPSEYSVLLRQFFRRHRIGNPQYVSVNPTINVSSSVPPPSFNPHAARESQTAPASYSPFRPPAPFPLRTATISARCASLHSRPDHKRFTVTAGGSIFNPAFNANAALHTNPLFLSPPATLLSPLLSFRSFSYFMRPFLLHPPTSLLPHPHFLRLSRLTSPYLPPPCTIYSLLFPSFRFPPPLSICVRDRLITFPKIAWKLLRIHADRSQPRAKHAPPNQSHSLRKTPPITRQSASAPPQQSPHPWKHVIPFPI